MQHLSGSPAIGYFLSVVPIIPPAAISSRDVGIVVAYLLATIALGLWVGRGQKDISDYLLGDRNLPWWAVLGSVVATETSTATVLSVPGLAYAAKGDMRYLQLAIGYVVGRVLVTIFLLPQYFQGQLFTSYEVLNRRFGGPTKVTASIMFLLARTAGDGLRLYLAAFVLSKFAGMSLPMAVLVTGVATIIYTVFGGMRSVVWNDCIQLVVYLVGAAVTLQVILSRLPGGFGGLIEFGESTGRFRIFDFSTSLADPYTFWAGVIGGGFLTLGTHGTDQLTVQRLLSARSQSDAGRALILSGFVVLGQFALFLLIGVGLAAYFQSFPPQLPIEKPDGAFATFIVEALPPGICGLMLAAVFAAAMSTLSSSLNASAGAAVSDLIEPNLQNPSPRRLLLLSRILTVFFGFAQVGIGLLGPRFGGSVVDNVLAIAALPTGIILGVFGLGVLTRRVTQPAALTGFIAGLFAVAAVKACTVAGYFAIGWPWYAFIGAISTFTVGYAASLVMTDRQSPLSFEDR